MSSYREKWREKPRWVRILTYSIMGLLAAVGMGILFGLIIMWLWNWLMPWLFDLKTINYWQAIGIFVLAKIIFGIGGGGGGGSSEKKAKDKKEHTVCVKADEDKKAEEHDEEYYDAWWEAVGKKSFEEYAKSRKNETKDCEQ